MTGWTRAILFARSMCSSMRWNSATSGSMASIRQRPVGPGIILRRCSSFISMAISIGSNEPTPHGRALLKRNIAIFDDLRTSVSELETFSDPTAGKLRIGCEENLSTGLLPTLIDRLTQRYPRLLFDVAPGDPATLQHRDLLDRRVVLAIMRIAHEDLDQALEASILCQDRMWIIAGISNPWAHRRKYENFGKGLCVRRRWLDRGQPGGGFGGAGLDPDFAAGKRAIGAGCRLIRGFHHRRLGRADRPTVRAG